MDDATPYPASLEIDYPDRPLNRVTTFFRVFTAIPITVVLGSLSNSEWLLPPRVATRRRMVSELRVYCLCRCC